MKNQQKELKSIQLRIAGVDAPECAKSCEYEKHGSALSEERSSEPVVLAESSHMHISGDFLQKIQEMGFHFVECTKVQYPTRMFPGQSNVPRKRKPFLFVTFRHGAEPREVPEELLGIIAESTFSNGKIYLNSQGNEAMHSIRLETLIELKKAPKQILHINSAAEYAIESDPNFVPPPEKLKPWEKESTAA